jgi:hypothetical protein
VVTITLSLVLLDGTRAWSDDAVETIVLVRHGEKPDKGLGQLDCQGLNRALALPPVIAKTFGRPSAIFAPDPSRQKQDDGVSYDYVRPLATIEPTAIFFGLPVNASRLAEAGRVDMEISPCPQIPSIANRSCSCTDASTVAGVLFRSRPERSWQPVNPCNLANGRFYDCLS